MLPPHPSSIQRRGYYIKLSRGDVAQLWAGDDEMEKGIVAITVPIMAASTFHSVASSPLELTHLLAHPRHHASKAVCKMVLHHSPRRLPLGCS